MTTIGAKLSLNCIIDFRQKKIAMSTLHSVSGYIYNPDLVRRVLQPCKYVIPVQDSYKNEKFWVGVANLWLLFEENKLAKVARVHKFERHMCNKV